MGFTYILKIIILAGLYVLTGKLGLLLAVPPGYATVIWPASGIAIGMLILQGWRLWPGVFLGSFILNCYISHAYTWGGGFLLDKTLVASGIAIGSTLQAILGRWLISHFIGLPLAFNRARQIGISFALAGPLACLVAASIGVATLYTAGSLSPESILSNWVTWWVGDVMGVIVFLPLIVLSPWGSHKMMWQGRPVGKLPVLALLVLVISLGMTFYSWKIVSENIYNQGLSEFENLALESEKALQHRIESYDYALLGGMGFFEGSDYVSRNEWRIYTEAINIKENFPGINGIGYITPVDPEQVDIFLKQTREDGVPHFEIHPESKDHPFYVITYIEPYQQNIRALGLNVGAEENRRQAAERARDTGVPAITRRITLVQDAEKSPGFLLLHPMYKKDMPINSVKERQAAFNGWIYAPFVAKNFLSGLTMGQSSTINLSVYDGGVENSKMLIYSSNTSSRMDDSAYRIRKTIRVMQQEWLLVWESTPVYEKMKDSEAPLFILIGGLSLTGIITIFLMLTMANRTEASESMTERRMYVIPSIIFFVTAASSYQLYATLKHKELDYIGGIVEEQALKIEKLISVQASEKIFALKRMAQRWESAEGTPIQQWRNDASNYVGQIIGLKAVEWVDPSYHVRWVEPLRGNESIIGLDILFDDVRKKSLEGSRSNNGVTITPPINLVQGYKGFIAYAPINYAGKFDGFIAGVFSIDDFLSQLISGDMSDSYAVYISHTGDQFFKNDNSQLEQDSRFNAERQVRLHDKTWTINVVPTRNFVENHISDFPKMIFIGGLLIALLLSLTVRYILVARLKSGYLESQKRELEASENTFRSAMDYASIGMALLDLQGRWLRVNPALCKIIGYSEQELIALDFQTITHPDDLEKDLQNVRLMLHDELQSYQIEKRYFHKNGQVIWANLSVSMARNPDGTHRHFISQIQDITEQKEMDRIKNEFISVVSHELRTPLTSIKGALGLIEGKMSSEVSGKAMHLINIAYKNCERLILLINDMLDLDKILSGEMRFNMKEEDVADLIESGIEMNAGYAEKFRIKIIYQQPPVSVKINIDADRWQQVFTNILSNAIKFSPDSGEVRVSVEKRDDKVRVLVQDSGPGIPDEFRSRIFGKFSQADSTNTRSKGGTGLGLNISKEIVNRMGGEIGFISEVGKGSTFWFEFPAL